MDLIDTNQIDDRTLRAQIEAVPTITRVDSIPLELLVNANADLRRRIVNAGDKADAVRIYLQRMSEERIARIPGAGNVKVQLYAWPVLFSYSAQVTRMKAEAALFTPGCDVSKRLGDLWARQFPASSKVVVHPLPSAVHLNSILDVSPATVHQCVFKGASLLEGGQPGSFSFLPKRPEFHDAFGPLVAPYLQLAYVVSDEDQLEVCASGDESSLRDASALLQALMSSPSEAPRVKLLKPQRFWTGLEAAHREQLLQFLSWAPAHGGHSTLQLAEDADEPSHVKVDGSYRSKGAPEECAVSWRYDRTWRTDRALAGMVEAMRGQMEMNKHPNGGVSAYRRSTATRTDRFH